MKSIFSTMILRTQQKDLSKSKKTSKDFFSEKKKNRLSIEVGRQFSVR
jgi:hypothetical protein